MSYFNYKISYTFISNDINFFLLQVSRCLSYYLDYVNVSETLPIEKKFFRIQCYYSSIYHKIRFDIVQSYLLLREKFFILKSRMKS